ncbi:MAG TPA: aminotransferase class III-fold pyridoxal phosphate-dependent enzyme, partial [Gemmatimonadales bacterium]|nr:aminotransferase class III-fold pyridoxal phosphate-dependent enzyme [Gemmatimonadales bacterium]
MSPVIQLRTEIPGPASRALLERRAAAVPRGVPAVTPIAVVHAEGAVITDADGNRLIDFAGGIGVVNTGHRHPGVVEAVRSQLERFAHVCFPVSTYEPYVR